MRKLERNEVTEATTEREKNKRKRGKEMGAYRS